MNDTADSFVWWFCTKDHMLQFGDRRLASVGETHTIDPDKIELCKFGLHGSIKAIDALRHAPGDHLFYCRLGGKIIHGDDKSVASQRTYLAGGVDVSDVFRKFAKRCALDSIHLWDAPQVVVDYLNSDSEELREEVQKAAYSAYCDLWGLYYSTNGDRSAAAYAAAAAHAASSMAHDIAWQAAINAIYAATGTSKPKEYNQWLEEMLNEKLGL